MRTPSPFRKITYALLGALLLGSLGCSSQDKDQDLADYHAQRVAGIDRLNGQEGMPDSWQTHFSSVPRTSEGEAIPVPQ